MNLHVAVLMRPYVELLLCGEKTVECRLTQTSREPFEKIDAGDRVFFKQSSGPYRATALVDHLLFERDLSPRRIREIQRDYNDVIRGDPDYWEGKSDAKYLSLIWLKEVEPTDRGPIIPELRGRAWVCLHEGSGVTDPSFHRKGRDRYTAQSEGGDDEGPFAISITPGNLKNGTLYITGFEDRFPSDAFGGATRQDPGNPITLILRHGPMVETDLVGPRKLVRSRVWRDWYRRIGAQVGDQVVFTPAGMRLYFVDMASTGK